MNVAAVRTALAELVDDTGLRCDAYVPDKVNPPCAFVAGPSGDFDQTFDGGVNLTFDVVVLVSRGDTRTGQERLDAYLADSGAASIKARVEADSELDGEVSSVRVSGWRDYGGRFTVGDTEYIGARVLVEVLI